MTRIHNYLILLSILLFSCKKNEVNKLDDFNVSPTQVSCNAGDTVIFTINGSPYIISFYSGEPGFQYSEKNTTSKLATPFVLFRCYMDQGTPPNGTPQNNDSLRLMVTNNLAGYDSASVKNATWYDITDSNKHWPNTLFNSLRPYYFQSDTVKLSAFTGDTTLNLAFQVKNKTYPKAQQRRWTIDTIKVSNLAASGKVSPIFSTFNNTGLVEVNITGKAAWNVPSWYNLGTIVKHDTINYNKITTQNIDSVQISTGYTVRFDPGNKTNVPTNEDWLITSKFNPNTYVQDNGLSVKNFANNPVTSYSYSYKTPGTYTATFVALNQTVYDAKQKTIQVTVVVH